MSTVWRQRRPHTHPYQLLGLCAVNHGLKCGRIQTVESGLSDRRSMHVNNTIEMLGNWHYASLLTTGRPAIGSSSLPLPKTALFWDNRPLCRSQSSIVTAPEGLRSREVNKGGSDERHPKRPSVTMQVAIRMQSKTRTAAAGTVSVFGDAMLSDVCKSQQSMAVSSIGTARV